MPIQIFSKEISKEKWMCQAFVCIFRFLILTLQIKPVSSGSGCIILILSINNMHFNNVAFPKDIPGKFQCQENIRNPFPVHITFFLLHSSRRAHIDHIDI